MKTITTEDLSSLSNPSDILYAYNGLDVLITHEVYQELHPQLDLLAQGTYTFSRSMQGPALEMMLRGLNVDPARKMEMMNRWEEKVSRYLGIFHTFTEACSGRELNPNSPKQMKELFYTHLGLKPQYVIVKGERKLSTNKEALEKLKQFWVAQPFINLITRIRETNKFLQVLRKGVDDDGRIRTSYNVGGTETGRWSSSANCFGTGDNLQNWPETVRSIIRADPGKKLAYCDLDTAESLGVGYLSGDEAYIAACHSGDVHTMVARDVWPELPWTGDLAKDRLIADEPYIAHHSRRFMCKGVGHGSNYYGQAPTIAKHLRMDVGPISAFQTQYFQRFNGIPKWHRAVAHQLHTKGYLITPFGRRRYFFGRRFEDETLREAIAYTPQSFIGDYLNIGLRKVWENQELRDSGLELLAQVHDAILIQYPVEKEQALIPKVLSLMSFPVPVMDINGEIRELTIPTSAETGWNWGHYELSENPHGLRKFRSGTPDERTAPKEATLLDCRL